MWGFAIDTETQSPLYIRECTSKSGHITLIIVIQDPLCIKLYSTTFIDEIKKTKEREKDLYYIDKKEVLNLKEDEVLDYSGMINIDKIKSILTVVLVDNDVEKIIRLIAKIAV